MNAMEHGFDHEYGNAGLTIARVDSLDAAVRHINMHGSAHTDAIVTSDEECVPIVFESN